MVQSWYNRLLTEDIDNPRKYWECCKDLLIYLILYMQIKCVFVFIEMGYNINGMAFFSFTVDENLSNIFINDFIITDDIFIIIIP